MFETPSSGEFKDGRGEFYDQETLSGSAILPRNGFCDITPDSSRFEQEFSGDGGKTWERNWVMTFTRTKSAQSCRPTDDTSQHSLSWAFRASVLR
jgi:hypothetical protein